MCVCEMRCWGRCRSRGQIAVCVCVCVCVCFWYRAVQVVHAAGLYAVLMVLVVLVVLAAAPQPNRVEAAVSGLSRDRGTRELSGGGGEAASSSWRQQACVHTRILTHLFAFHPLLMHENDGIPLCVWCASKLVRAGAAAGAPGLPAARYRGAVSNSHLSKANVMAGMAVARGFVDGRMTGAQGHWG